MRLYAASSLPAAANLLLNAMLLFPHAWVTSVLRVTSLPLPPNPHPPPHPSVCPAC